MGGLLFVSFVFFFDYSKLRKCRYGDEVKIMFWFFRRLCFFCWRFVDEVRL